MSVEKQKEEQKVVVVLESRTCLFKKVPANDVLFWATPFSDMSIYFKKKRAKV